MKQYVVDAFTDSVFHGNQAAVCVLDSWLPEELIKLDSRFKIVNSPIGKMMIKNATLADLSEKAGLSTDELLQKLQEMVDRHNGI